MANIDVRSLLKKLLVCMIVGVATLTVIVICGDLQKMRDVAWSIDGWILVQAGWFAICIYVGRFLKWQLFLRALQINLPVLQTFPVFFAGLSMGLTPGKVGEVLKSYLLEKLYGVTFERSAPTIIVERLTGILGCFVLCVLSLAYLGQGSYYSMMLSVVVLSILGVTILAFCNRYAAEWMIGHLVRIKFLALYREKIEKFYEGTIKLLGVRILLLGVCISSVYWLMECMVFYSLLQGVGEDIGIMTSVLILTSVSIGGGLTMMPGSVGALEGGLLGVLVYQGLSMEAAGCVVLLHRIFAMWSVIVIGLFVLGSRYRHAIV